MPLHPSPEIDSGLALVVQPLLRSDLPRPALLTFAFKDVTPPSTGSAQTFINFFQTTFNSRFQAQLDTEVSIQLATCKVGDGSSTPFEATATGALTNGTGAISPPPPNCALLIKKSTGVAGKKNRGRTYVPWSVDMSHVSETGVLDNAFLAAEQVHLDGFLADFVGNGTPMVIANKVLSSPTPPNYVTNIHVGAEVLTYKLENQLATQRRRLRS